MITLRPVEAQLIAEATDRIIAGESKGSIARWLNQNGHRTFGGEQWTGTAVGRLLLRERNAGRFTRNGVIQSESRIQPLVSPKRFDQCKAVLTAAPRVSVEGPASVINWLSGLMRCGVCQRVMRPYPATHGERGYGCEVRRRGARTGTDRHVCVLARIAENKVYDSFLGWMSDDGSKRPVASLVRQDTDRRLADLAEARALATDVLMQPGADRRSIASQLAAIAAEINILARTHASVTASSSGRVEWSSFVEQMSDEPNKNCATSAGRLWIAEEWWERTPVDVRRSILRDSFAIEVLKGGRGARRVIVTPR